MWEEVCVIAESVVLNDDSDELKWQFQSSGIYFSHSLHSVINFRGIVPMFILAVWKIVPPPGSISSCGCCQITNC
jgi:hypothetical protein